MPLYGHDMSEAENPFEAGIGWAVDLTKPSFTGRDALVRNKESGAAKRLVGFEMIDRGIPRQHYEIQTETGETIGAVTSGTQSPSLKKAIGMGYVQTAYSKEGTEIFVRIREKNFKAKVVKVPFYKK